jgi:hypothetical protein
MRATAVPPAVPPAAAAPRAISDTMSGSDVARLAGLSKQRVSVLRRQGHSPAAIIAEQASKRASVTANQGGREDGHRDGEHSKRGKGRGKQETWLEARSRKESYLADLRAMEVQRRRGELVLRSEVESYCAGAIIYFRDALLRLPAELRDRCAEQPGAVVEALFFGELHRLLCDFARGMRMTEKRAEEIQAGKKGKRVRKQ